MEAFAACIAIGAELAEKKADVKGQMPNVPNKYEVREMARNLKKPVNVDYLKEVVKTSGKTVEAFCNRVLRTTT